MASPSADVGTSAPYGPPDASQIRERLLGNLVREHGKALLAYTEKLVNDRHLAEDITQETLIRAWRHTERLHNSEGSIRGWLLTVARNLVIDRSRSAPIRYEAVGVDAHDQAQRDHADAVVASVAVAGMLRSLSLEHRAVLVHTYLWGRTVRETAQILGIPVGTVKSRQHYALSSLRQDERARFPRG